MCPTIMKGYYGGGDKIFPTLLYRGEIMNSALHFPIMM